MATPFAPASLSDLATRNKSHAPAYVETLFGADVSPAFIDRAAAMLSRHFGYDPAAAGRSIERFINAQVAEGVDLAQALGQALILAIENDLD